MKVAVRLALGVLALGVVACGRGPVAPEVARQFEDAREWRQQWLAATDQANPAQLMALGYLERARLGLGSPFRLVDQALADPRLSPALRRRTAWALLAMTFDRETYVVEPAALDSIGNTPATTGPGAGALHLAAIADAVREADDPLDGEATVRLAYSLAGAERLVRSGALTPVARATAQLRDRELARADLLALLREARDEDVSPLALVPAWRVGRRFAVESPRLASTAAVDDSRAVARVPALLERLRQLSTDDAALAASEMAVRHRLPAEAGRRLLALDGVQGMPPQAPVVVAFASSRRSLLKEGGLGGAERERRARLVAGARNEETLAAAYAQLGDAPGTNPALAALWAASALRPYAQERVWFPGFGGPTAQELRAGYGVRAVTFDAAVPEAWRPYFRRMLANAAEDLRRVLPAIDLTGLRVHFSERPMGDHALALHDPRTRTIYLPVTTGAGAIAHELAHDLDWQVAERDYNRRGDYSTDEAVRGQRGQMANTLRALTSATLVAPTAENRYQAPHAQRPTEVFASSVDWYVAAALAREGRANGYLTSVQDELLTGYAAVSTPDVQGEAGDATMAVLAQMTALPPVTRDWYLHRYGLGRTPTSLDLMRRVLDVATPSGSVPFAAGHGALRGLASPVLPRCTSVAGDEDARTAANRQVAVLAAESLARREVTRRGVPVPGGYVAPGAVNGSGVWAPEVVEAELVRVRNAILDRAQSLEQARSLLPVAPSYLTGDPDGC